MAGSQFLEVLIRASRRKSLNSHKSNLGGSGGFAIFTFYFAVSLEHFPNLKTLQEFIFNAVSSRK